MLGARGLGASLLCADEIEARLIAWFYCEVSQMRRMLRRETRFRKSGHFLCKTDFKEFERN